MSAKRTNRIAGMMAAASASQVAFVAHAAPATPVPDSLDPPVGLAEVLGMGFSLVMIIGAVVLVGWLYARSQGVRGAGGDVISILAAQPLGPKERIVLVEVGGKQIVLGMTSAQVQTLHVFDEPVVTGSQKTVAGTAFADRLRSALRGMAR